MNDGWVRVPNYTARGQRLSRPGELFFDRERIKKAPENFGSQGGRGLRHVSGSDWFVGFLRILALVAASFASRKL